MHKVEYPSIKPARREVTVHCSDAHGAAESRRVPLVSLATFILNSVQATAARKNAAQIQGIDWSNSNV
jgi:hypothetical protein